MPKLRWSIKALIDFDEAQAYIAQENSFAAHAVAERIWQASSRLVDMPRVGKAGLVPGTFQLVVLRTPYLIIYRIEGETVEILRVWHGRRNWIGMDEQ